MTYREFVNSLPGNAFILLNNMELHKEYFIQKLEQYGVSQDWPMSRNIKVIFKFN